MFRSILVAIDGSPTAERGLESATALAQALNAKLTIVSVAPEVPGFAYGAGVDTQALEREAESETEKLLRAAVDSLPADLPATTVLRHGNAGEQIVKQVVEGDHDLLVMGSRGRSRVVSNLLGSAAAYVHYHSRVAMLVIQPQP